jgi:serine/threonine protein kinase
MQDAFLAEARRVARLRHPAIVPVHDIGTDGETWFIVSEFMDGGSLADRLAREPIGLSSALRWMTQIAGALDFAHRTGIVHRDVKPANILINHHGDAVLADFGIAQSATKSGEFAPSAGTLRYMAPEQKSGVAVDHSADIYSLGIVLHEALTGTTPCANDACPADQSEFPRDCDPRLSLSLPPRLAAVCRRALRHEPAERYLTAAAFAAELNAAAANDSKWPLVLGLAVAAVISTVPFVLWSGMLTDKKSNTIIMKPRVTLVTPSLMPAPPIDTERGSRSATIMFRRIAEAQPYISSSRDVASYSEWQDPPDTYLGPLRNDVVCFVIYRFDFTEPTVSGTLIAETRCWDFTTRPGGYGRGVAAIDVSSGGVEWVAIRDSTIGPEWGKGWTIEEPLPAVVLGGTSLWVRARFLTNGSPNTNYTVAQFGRNRDDASQPTFGIVVELQSVPQLESQNR